AKLLALSLALQLLVAGQLAGGLLQFAGLCLRGAFDAIFVHIGLLVIPVGITGALRRRSRPAQRGVRRQGRRSAPRSSWRAPASSRSNAGQSKSIAASAVPASLPASTSLG